MKFKTDENLHPEVAEILKGHGHDAITIWDEDLRGASDGDVAQVCRREQRVLITLDTGFADIRRYPPDSFSGIVVLRLARQSRKAVITTMERLLTLFDRESIPGSLWIVEEHRVRVRGRADGGVHG